MHWSGPILTDSAFFKSGVWRDAKITDEWASSAARDGAQVSSPD